MMESIMEYICHGKDDNQQYRPADQYFAF